jgi:glutamine cyclotransferase
MRLFLFLFTVSMALACGGTTSVSNNSIINANKSSAAVPTYTYEIVNSYPHDPKAFTQGLIFRDGLLFESTGEYRESTLRKVELSTGKILQKHDLPPEYFAEGMTILGDKIYQVTWRERTAFEYDVNDLKLLREIRYSGDGWGLTNDGTNLIMSDGTHVIRVVNPQTFQTIRTIVVFRENGKPLMEINELEYVNGEIWTNIWHSEEPEVLGKPNHIARIDPANGKLLGWIDLSGISPDDQDDASERENTLNGIAYDAVGDRIFVTGKNWKRLFEIKVKPK